MEASTWGPNSSLSWFGLDRADWGLIQDLTRDPYRNWRTHFPGRRAVGYFCTYAPLEVLHAAGFAPVRLMQLGGPVARADAHLPSYSCALVRAASERLLSGELDFLSGVLFVHTCDTMQCVADIWRMARPSFPVLNFSLPTVLSSTHAREYCRAVLHRLMGALEDLFAVRITEAALRASIALYNEQRRLLAELYNTRERYRPDLLYTLMLAGMLMPVEEHNRLMRSALRDLQPQPRRQSRPRILLIGATMDDLAIPRLFEDLGGLIVGDDLCTGSRYVEAQVEEEEEPLKALAERFFRRPPCPAKYDPARPRAVRVLDLVRSAKADCAVLILPKFCDPHAFDCVPVTEALDRAGVPTLLLETDITASLEQARTRLQAFVEMVRGLSGHDDMRG